MMYEPTSPVAPVTSAVGTADGQAGKGSAQTSARLSPRLGPIALGMVRREVALGDEVVVRWDGGETRATVVGLPFEG